MVCTSVTMSSQTAGTKLPQPNLQLHMNGPRLPREHAIIIGGSLAGLVTARVLSDLYDRVTLIERDPLPAGIEPRRGVPQARHVHVLLVRGQELYERLFPGLRQELVAAGAPLLDAARDLGWFTPAGWV